MSATDLDLTVRATRGATHAVRRSLTSPFVFGPILAIAVLAFSWGRDLPALLAALVAIVLAGAALAAVHHAEVVASE